MAAACAVPPRPTTAALSASPSSFASGPDATVGADDGTAWRLVGTGDQSTSTQLTAVAATQFGFVVVGSAGQAGEIPIAYSSTDGSTWTQEAITGRSTTPRSLQPWGDRTLAIGGGSTNRCAHPSEIDTWVREAGGAWTEAPFDPVLCAGPRSGSLVFLDGRPWLVGAGTADVPALMESADGLSWTNHPERLGDVFPIAAAVDASGLVVLARAPDGSTLVLRTDDGRRFSSDPLTGVAGAPVDVLAAVTTGEFVRVFVTEGNRVRMLTPTAGGALDDEAVGGIGATGVQGIRVIDGQLVAFIANPDDGHVAVWGSSTGTEWRPLLMPGALNNAIEVLDLAAANGVAVVVGRVPSPDGSGTIGAMWTGPSALLKN